MTGAHHSRPGAWAERLGGIQQALVVLLAAAAPWGLFQRLPFTPVTLTKLLGLAIVACGVARLCLKRPFRLPRTPLDGPILLFLAACLLAAFLGPAPAGSVFHIRVFAAYALFFFVTAPVLGRPGAGLTVCRVYTLSALGPVVLLLACSWGPWLPAKWEPLLAAWSDTLPALAQAGTPMRFAAVFADFNEEALHFLVAAAFALFVFRPSKHRAGWLVPVLLSGAFFTAMYINRSRSAMFLFGAMVAARLLMSSLVRRSPRFRRALAVAVALIFVAAGVAAWPWLFEREQDTWASRVRTYEVAVRLLPRHGLLGVGPGNSRELIARSGALAIVDKAEIHNVPLKLWLETGLLGMAAYLWLLWRLAARVLAPRMRKAGNGEKRLASALAAAAVCIWAVQLLQPLVVLPMFPLLLAVAGGLAVKDRALLPREPSSATAHAALPLVGLLAVANIAVYQHAGARVSAFGEALAEAPWLERDGLWAPAREGYENALAIAQPSPKDGGPAQFRGGPLNETPFFVELALVADLPARYEHMNMLRDRPDPSAACAFGIARTHLSAGSDGLARDWLSRTLRLEPEFAEAWFLLAETCWTAGDHAEAIAHYGRAREAGALWRNLDYSLYMDRSLRPCPETPDPAEAGLNSLLARAADMRRLGRWDEARVLYRQVLDHDSGSAEALFNLGVDAEMAGEREEALGLFRQALRVAPNHLDAARALGRLEAGGAPPDRSP